MKKKKTLIDISYHQGDIDFKLVKESGVEGVILREGYRKTIDSKFVQYANDCVNSGLQIYAAYHFMYPLNVEDAINEAISCVNNVKKAGLDPESIIIFADYEYDTVTNAAKNGVTLTKEDCNVFTEAFCAAVEKLGYNAGIYMNLDYYRNYYIDVIKNKYPLWLADYTGDADYSCLIHQYTNSGNVSGIKTNVDMNYLFYEETEDKTPDSNFTAVSKVLELARSWVGKKESDGSYKEIVDIYNSYNGAFPRGLKMQYGWSWCACTWSALAIKLGYTHIMPIEISCGELVKAAEAMGCWVENDRYIPSPGDAVLFDWQDSGINDNVGWPDHIGLVEAVNQSSGYFTTIEGNYDDSVKKRTVSINGKHIRGFIHPNYDIPQNTSEDLEDILPGKDVDVVAHEVIAGLWGNMPDRKTNLESKGYDYESIRSRVNEILNGNAVTEQDPNVDLNQPYNKKITSSCRPKAYKIDKFGIYQTTADLFLRNDAGTNKKALCVIPKNTIVRSSGHYTNYSNVDWLYVNFIMNGVYYGGFSSSKYLEKK